MTHREVDVAVIGAGTAGLAAYRAAKAGGAQAVLIEGGVGGTTCARVGCMPSKLLIAAAEASHAIDKAPGFGVHIEGRKVVNGREVMDRVKRERDRFVGFVLRGVDNIPPHEKLHGYARFLDDHTLELEDCMRIGAKSIVIATGSSPSFPASFKQLGSRLVLNDDVFNWDDLPESVAVIGPGVIGLELGQALHRLGVRVVVLGRGGRIGPVTDPAVRSYAIEAFNREFPVDPDAHIARMTRVGDRVEIEYTAIDGTPRIEQFDYVLAATGRIPNVAGLSLENTSLKLDAKGIPNFDPLTAQTQIKSGTSHIFIAGDASNFLPLLHEAADEGRIAGDNAARVARGNAAQGGLRRAPLGIVFTEPQIAIVGAGHALLKPGTFTTGQVSFEDQGRSRVMLRNVGMLHVYADTATGLFLGAEMLGPSAEHIGHLLSWALANKMTVPQMLDMPFYHPVVEEGLRTALRDLDAKLREQSIGKAA
jgi:dihydrolipoamide dehydrogenase